MNLTRQVLAVGNDLRRLALGEGHHGLLAGAVEVLARRTRGAQIVEDHRGVAARVLGLEVHGLLDRLGAAEARAIGQMAFLLGALAGALDEGDRADLAAVRGALQGTAVGRLGEPLQLEIGHHVRGRAVGEFRELVGVVGFVIRRLDDGAEGLGEGRARFALDVRAETARGAGGLGDLRAQVDLDLAVRQDLGDQRVDPRVFRQGQVHVVAVGHIEGRGAEGDALIEILPDPAQHRLVANEMDRVAGLGRLQGRGHAGHAAADHQDGLVERLLAGGLRDIQELDLRTGHADVVVRHLLGGLLVLGALGAGPDDALAQIGAGHGDRREGEGLHLGAPGAGGDHQVGGARFDVVPDELDALRAAQQGVLLHGRELALLGGDRLELVGIQALANAAAGADISG